MTRFGAVMGVTLLLAAPVGADELIRHANDQEALSLALAPVHAGESGGNAGAALGNNQAGTRYVFGYKLTRTRTLLGIPDLYTDLEVGLGVATLRYDGSAVDPASGTAAPLNSAGMFVQEAMRLRVGRSVALGRDAAILLTPFLGMSTQAWERGGATRGAADFSVQEGVEAGALAQASLPQKWVLGADAALGRTLGTVLLDGGSGNSLYGRSASVALHLDHRTFADWHQRLEVRQTFLRYAPAVGPPRAIEPRRRSDLAFMLVFGTETGLFQGP